MRHGVEFLAQALGGRQQAHVHLCPRGVRDPESARAREDPQRGIRLPIAHLPLRDGRDLDGGLLHEPLPIREPAAGRVHSFHLLAHRQRPVDEELVHEAIGKGVQEGRGGARAVAPRPPRLLVVRLERSRHRVMHHETDVRLVDPHAERVGRDDHPGALAHERVLHLRAVRVVQPRVVGHRIDLRALQHHGDAFHRLARAGVDNRHPRVLLRSQERDERRVLGRVVPGRDDVVRQVRAIEPREYERGILQRELARDVLPHLRRRGGRERDRRWRAQPLPHLPHAQVTRTEVVPPFTDAVRLVHGEQSHADRAQSLGGGAQVEPLRCEVEQPDLAALDAGHPRTHFGGRERAVDVGGGKSARLERVDLILHQGDEGRDHDRQTAEQEGRDLIAE